MDSTWNLVLVPIVGLAVWFVRSHIEGIKRATEELQDQRRKIYIDILKPYIQTFAGIKDPSQTKKALRTLTSFEYRLRSFELNMIGSDEVVRAVNNMMQFFYSLEKEDTTAQPADLLRYWGGVLLAIRRDLGNRRTKLKEVDMLRSQIKDIDTVTGA